MIDSLSVNVNGHKDGKQAREHMDRLGIPYELEVEIVYVFRIPLEQESRLGQVFGKDEPGGGKARLML